MPPSTKRVSHQSKADRFCAGSCALHRTPSLSSVFLLPLVSCATPPHTRREAFVKAASFLFGRTRAAVMFRRVKKPSSLGSMEAEQFVLFIFLCYLSSRFAGSLCDFSSDLLRFLHVLLVLAVSINRVGDFFYFFRRVSSRCI